jgi:hypothetical protein
MICHTIRSNADHGLAAPQVIRHRTIGRGSGPSSRQALILPGKLAVQGLPEGKRRDATVGRALDCEPPGGRIPRRGENAPAWFCQVAGTGVS